MSSNSDLVISQYAVQNVQKHILWDVSVEHHEHLSIHTRTIKQ